MAYMGWEKTGRRWRVFWHVTLPTGEIDKGSRSFKDKMTAKNFKEHCEKREKILKRTVFVKQVYLNDALDEWAAFCLGYTEETRKLYIELVGKFISDLPDNVVYISDLTKIHINRHLNSLMGRGLANKTVNNSMCAIKSLCLYIYENYNTPNPAKGIKKLTEVPPEPNFLTAEEYAIVLKNSTQISRQWIRFIASTGLRAAEFCGLQWRNCDIKNRTITIVGKGRKRRSIWLNDTALSILKKAKTGRNVRPTDAVFVRDNGKALSRYCLSHYIGKACRDSGFAGGPHSLRHYFATQLLLHGVPIIKVSALLGHSIVTTTQRHYSHILPSDLSDVTSVLKAV